MENSRHYFLSLGQTARDLSESALELLRDEDKNQHECQTDPPRVTRPARHSHRPDQRLSRFTSPRPEHHVAPPTSPAQHPQTPRTCHDWQREAGAPRSSARAPTRFSTSHFSSFPETPKSASGRPARSPSRLRTAVTAGRGAPARGRRSSKAGRHFKAGSAGDVRTPTRGRSPPSAAGARPWRRPGGLLGAGGGSIFLTRKRFPCTAIGFGRDGNAEFLGKSHAESWSWRLFAELLKCRVLCFVVVAFCDAEIFAKSSRRGFHRFLEYLA